MDQSSKIDVSSKDWFISLSIAIMCTSSIYLLVMALQTFL